MLTEKELRASIEYNAVGDLELPRYWTTVLFGDTGKRKTTSACAMVKERGLLVSADDSWKVLDKPIHKDLKDRTDLVVYDSASQLDFLNFGDYDTVILDTVSSMIERFLDLLHEEARWSSPKYREAIITDNKELNGTTIIGRPDYHATRNKFRPIVERLCRKAPAHIIFTAHVGDPTEDDLTRRPRIPNATWKIIKEFADIIGYIRPKGKGGFSIGVDESAVGYVGKSRLDGVSGEMDLDSFVTRYREKVHGITKSG